MSFPVEKVIEQKLFMGMPVGASSSKTRAYWAGVHNKTVVFDPAKVADQLTAAKAKIGDVSMSDVLVLYDKGLYREELEKLAEDQKFHYLNYRIPSGVLTNFDTLLSRIRSMNEIADFLETDAFAALTKKEQIMKKRQLAKLQKTYKGVRYLTRKPKLVVIIDAMAKPKFLNEVVNVDIPAIVLASSDFNRWMSVADVVLLNTQSYSSIDTAVQYLLGK